MRRNLDKQFGKFPDYLREITITIPFVDAIRDMPAWGKFLKDVISHKSKLEDYGLVSLVEESKAIVSLMPYSIYKRLNLDELNPTNMCLSMVDKSITYPLGILENVLTKVGKFIIPADFVGNGGRS
eukprot:XP_015577168.1 uncharacterized protein LOC107261562 [Ricinus communis]